VVGFLVYVFMGVSYATMGPQAFFQALAHIAAIASVIAIVWVFLWVRRDRERMLWSTVLLRFVIASS
jgi:positive regulator of sigma E activity